MNMSYGYLTANTGLGSILAQLLEPLSRPRTRINQDAELAEESELALTLRLLLEPDQEIPRPNQPSSAGEHRSSPGDLAEGL
jgi:hypothetical protein